MNGMQPAKDNPMSSQYLIKATQKILANADPTDPFAWERRIAITNAYYAMFHTLCEICREPFIQKPEDANLMANEELYRSLNHSIFRLSSQTEVREQFGDAIANFMIIGAELKNRRESSSYASRYTPSQQETQRIINNATSAIKTLQNLSQSARREFAAYLIAKNR